MNGTINSSVTATPSDFSSATHQPHVPREILAVKDAKNYKPRGKTIIICLDGTGDKFDNDNSNIVHLVGCLKKSSPNQVTYYQSGIGTYDGGGLSNGFNAAVDMAVGSGLGVHIKDAYRFLMGTYNEGDKISLFGFSRGAYTARCLAGMVHKVGLLPSWNDSQVDFAYQYYKDDSPGGWKMSNDFKKTFCMTVNIYFVGVFDSVASVGFIPRRLPLSSTPTQRSQYFRHAMAIDERRAKFKPCRYQAKNAVGPDAKWVSREEDPPSNTNNTNTLSKKDSHDPGHDTDVLEVWFTGCHADVGGGAVQNEERHKLAQVPLRWMLRQCFACDTGIIFKTHRLAEEGIDVHNLWPVYQAPAKPFGSPPPDLMEKYAEGKLGPIARRSTLLAPVDATDPFGMHKLQIYEDEEKMVHRDEWVPEQVEDYLDGLQPINDQLAVAKGWWVLEYWPIKVRVQPKNAREGEWVKKVSVNKGRYRCAQEMRPNLHWTVKHRQDAMGYQVRARVDKNAQWNVVM